MQPLEQREPPTVIHDGEPAPCAGWYIDLHGHTMFLPEGYPAPVCPHGAEAPQLWRRVDSPLAVN